MTDLVFDPMGLRILCRQVLSPTRTGTSIRPVSKLAKGMTVEVARHEICWSTDRSCAADQCVAWQWNRRKPHWRHYLIHRRRGRCRMFDNWMKKASAPVVSNGQNDRSAPRAGFNSHLNSFLRNDRRGSEAHLRTGWGRRAIVGCPRNRLPSGHDRQMPLPSPARSSDRPLDNQMSPGAFLEGVSIPTPPRRGADAGQSSSVAADYAAWDFPDRGPGPVDGTPDSPS
jgi:hypothetical protein